MHWLWAADDSLFHLFNGHPSLAPARAAAGLLLLISSGGACWLALFSLLFLIGGRRGRRIALTGALAVLLAHAVAAWGLSGLFQRADPALTFSRGIFTLSAFQPRFSFPATRTAEALAAVPFLSRGGPAATGLIWTAVVGIAWAEVYAGTAFPTDLLGGALVGLVSAGLTVWILGTPFRRPRGQVIPLPRRPRRASGTPSVRRRR